MKQGIMELEVLLANIHGWMQEPDSEPGRFNSRESAALVGLFSIVGLVVAMVPPAC